MDRAEVLSTANDIINGERQEDYGDADIMFTKIANMWATYTGHNISALDVAMMMSLLKIARSTASPQKADNYIDLSAYSALAAEIAGAK